MQSIVVADLGEAVISKDTSLTTGRGTTLYMAPERFKLDGKPSFKTDIWSSGVVIYEMAHLNLPFQSQEEIITFRTIKFAQNSFSIKLKPLLLK